MIYALSHGLYGESVPLTQFKKDANIAGVGMSDWDGYAAKLKRLFHYRNTFYDRKPMLDIKQPDWAQFQELDFVISTDVFEHILAPVQIAFDNVYKMLAPGGSFVFTVPYIDMEDTIEHFPGLSDYKFFDFDEDKLLVNRRPDGGYDLYHDLIFHGGEGSTLEMRIFSKQAIVRHLEEAGFSSIEVFEEPELSIGYYWPPLPDRKETPPFLGHVLLARKAVQTESESGEA